MSRWLIVEDDLGAAEALAQTLLKAGCEVGVVHNAADAMNAIDETFQGVIIDLHLPDFSGSELVKKLRKKFPHKLYGLVTGEEPENIEKIAKKCQADFWMTKPIDTEKLIMILNGRLKIGGAKMMRKIGILLAILAGLIAGLILSANLDIVRETVAENSSKELPEIATIFADVAEEAMPSVVTITSAKVYNVPVRSWSPFFDDPFFQYFFGPRRRRYREYRQEGLGSGVIVSRDGYILTNAHVVNGADEIQIHIGDDEYDAEIVGVDEKTDIAVLKIDADRELPIAKIGDSDKLRVGEWVLAIGSPFKLEHSVTAGIISAKERSGMGITDYEDFIQTDAAINPGNSGGALVNLKGELVGINTAIISGTGGNIGIGLAVPINLAQKIFDQLVEHGKVIRGWLGITIQNVTSELAEALGMNEPLGVLVSSVLEDSPAEQAGIQRGDVITEVDGKSVDSAEQLRNLISSTPPGTRVKISILRNGTRRTLFVKLGELPEEMGTYAKLGKNQQKDIGLSLKALSRYEARQMGYDGKGVLVVDVNEGSIAYKAGIRQDDIIVEVNQTPVETPAEVQRVISELKRGDTILFVVWRNGYTMYLAGKLK